jgi:hypothetical protein
VKRDERVRETREQRVGEWESVVYGNGAREPTYDSEGDATTTD